MDNKSINLSLSMIYPSYSSLNLTYNQNCLQAVYFSLYYIKNISFVLLISTKIVQYTKKIITSVGAVLCDHSGKEL